MTLEAQFRDRLDDAIRQSIDLGYRPTRIQQMLANGNAVEVAKRLVSSTEIQDGMMEMKKVGRLDLTIEQIMLEPQFKPLFKEIDREWAKLRLEMLNQ